MHAAMKYVILNTIQNNNVIVRENDINGFTTYIVLNKSNQPLLSVHYNWKYKNYFVHTANDQTVTEGKMPTSKYAHISKHHYDLEDIVTACFRKAHNIAHGAPQSTRRPVSEHFLQVAVSKMWDEERARFMLLNKSVHVK
ncbi:MAG: hypothetical protein K2M34_02035 [Alphaproteobacteria bacterium]|nr:hypothetical protein [Alphaproteobacteria bacterium]